MPTSVEELIAALGSEDASTRLGAAASLRDRTPPPVEAVAALVAHIGDDGSIDEEWTDWDGTVVGGTTHFVSDRVREALVRIGTPAFTALVTAIEGGGPATVLDRFIRESAMDVLCAAGDMAVARARRIFPPYERPAHVKPSLGAADALVWAHGEMAGQDDRTTVLVKRLGFLLGPTSALAAEELGTVAATDAPRAALALATFLLRGERGEIFVQKAAASSLDKLGPVLPAEVVEELVAAVRTPMLFYCLPQVMPAIAQYPAAAELGPWLLAWVRDDKASVSIGTDYHREVRQAAAVAIGRLGEGARPLHDELVALYAKGANPGKWVYLLALPDRRVILDRLGKKWRRALEGDDRSAILDTLSGLNDLEAGAAPMFDAILPFVDGPRGYWMATVTVGYMGETARPAVPALIRALKQRELREWACISLQRLGRDVAAPAIPALEELAAEEKASGVRNARAQHALNVLRGAG